MLLNDFLFTSESVSEGHPDKIADQISDAILDAYLKQDRQAHVACETLIKTGFVIVAGEISSLATLDIEPIVRKVIDQIGYNHSDLGFDAHTCAVLSALSAQSPDILQGVKQLNPKDQGAGDQGLMFGYATDETDVLMPAPIRYAHLLMQKQSLLRKQGTLPWLRPDAKTQLTFHYENNLPQAITHIVFSTQHHPDASHAMLKDSIIEEVIKTTIPAELLKETTYLINPTGRFVVGGPQGDCGLTGRKIIVDSYGGMARHGGGCFSGKDPSKVDRTGAYLARYIAKNLVGSGLCKRCEVQISYAIGVADPISLQVESFETSRLNNQQLVDLVLQHFPLRPYQVIAHFDLLRPIYQATASYGHFGRDDLYLPWESLDKAEQLRSQS